MRSVYAATTAFFTVSVCHAGMLVGIAVDPNLYNLNDPFAPYSQMGLPYRIDPMTGATTLITQNFTWYDIGPVGYPGDNHLWLVAGDSPYPATIFGASPVNLSSANFDTGVGNFYYSGGYAFDLAYDSDHNVLYSSTGDSLATIPLVPCSGPCPPIPKIGGLPFPIYAMGYVPGDGLYGVDAYTGMLYRINGDTAALTQVGFTGVGLAVNGLSITDIEFDTATGRMIASAGGPEGLRVGPFLSGKIYLLDRFTGSTTLLNDNAPNFFSLVEVSPEPASLILMGAGLLALGVRWRFRQKLS